MIDLDRASIRKEAFEEAAKLAETYAEVNIEVCGDNIILDPLMHGEPWTPENVRKSKDCQILSAIHSAKYHAGMELAETIRRILP